MALSKKDLVEVMTGISLQMGGTATPEARRDYFNRLPLAQLQSEYETHSQKVANAALAASTSAELALEELRMENEKAQRDWHAKQNPPADPKENRRIFAQVCRQCGIAENDANFSLLVQACGGDLFDSHVAGQAVKKNPGAYARVSPQEQQKWAQEDAQAQREATIKHQHWLQHKATPQQLREAAQRERQQKIENRTFAQERLHEEIAMARQRDLARGVIPLPERYNNEPLTSEFVKRASILTLKNLIQKFGQGAITSLLYGVKEVHCVINGEEVHYKFELPATGGTEK